jgi:hypothetical protein
MGWSDISRLEINLTLAFYRCNFDSEINNPQMSGIIKGYTYDIFFISCHNNKAVNVEMSLLVTIESSKI